MMAFAFAPMAPAMAQTTSSSTSSTTLPTGVSNLAGTDEFLTANAIANAEYPKGTSTAVLACGLQANWIDSLTAAPLAKALKAPILLTQDASTVGTETMNELKTLGVTKVYLVGIVANSTNAPKIESQLGSGVSVTTIHGSNRYQTAGQVAGALARLEGVTTFPKVFVASGENAHLVDALAADPVAAQMGAPILLVPNTGDKTSYSTQENDLLNAASTAYLIGRAHQYSFNGLPSSVSPVTVYGSTRASTAAAIDQQFAPSSGYSSLFIANGVDTHLVDALTAGPLIAADKAALAEVYSGTVPSSTTSLLKSSLVSGVTAMTVVGGPGSIPSQLYDTSSAPLTSLVTNLGVTPKISVANASIGTGAADTLTLSGVPSNATVNWSVTSSNSATGLVSGHADTATFVGTAPGSYAVQASVNGLTASATVTVFGQASAVKLSPASSTVVADGEATDAVTLTVTDGSGSTVSNFNGMVDINAQSGVTYTQSGSTLTPNSSGTVAVTVTSGSATFDVGSVSVPGVTVNVNSSNLTSSNGQTIASSPTYASTTITSAPQSATSLKIVGAPKYLSANSITATPEIAVVVEDQAGYPMLTGTNSVTVSLSGSATFVGGSSSESLVYDGFAAPAGTSNTSAQFMVQSQQGVTGSITISASGSGLTPTSTTIQSVIAGSATQVSASLSSNSFVEGSSGITLNLQAEDAQGVPVGLTSASSVTVTVSKSGSTSMASNITVNTTSSTSPLTESVTTSGTLSLTLADNGSAADAGSYTVTVAPASGAPFSFATQTLNFTETASGIATAAFTSPSGNINVSLSSPTAQYTLQLEDQYGNPVATSGVTASVYALETASPTTSTPSYGSATVNGSSTSSSSLISLTTNSQGQALATLAAQAFPGAVWELSAALSSPSVTSVSKTMTVSSVVPASLSVGLKDASSGTFCGSTAYATAGDTVSATLTLNDQYGAAINETLPLTLSVPAGLSGNNLLAGTSSASSWVYGGSNTVTLSENVVSGTVVIPLKAWSEGSATLGVSVPGLTSSVSGSSTMYVQPGPAVGVGLFSNGSAVTSGSPLSVTANTPVTVTVEATDVASNPEASAYPIVVALNGAGGSFRTSVSGAATTTATIPAGQTGVTLYYVNASSVSVAPTVSPEVTNLQVLPTSVSVSLGSSTTVTAGVYSSSTATSATAVSGQGVTASVTSGSGTVSSTATSSGGLATFTYTAPTSSASGTATITISVPGTKLSSTVSVTY